MPDSPPSPSSPALAAAATLHAGGAAKPTSFRWVVCALLFYATTINYIDRSTLNTLEPTLRDVIHWRPYQYGLINATFSLAYGLGYLLMGFLIDRIGTRLTYALAMTGWSLSGIATAFTATPMQFGLARFSLGLCESGNFPAAIKTVAEWFPQKQRSTATGIVNAGSNVGAVCAPLIVMLLVPFFENLYPHYGWRAAFFVTPIFALVWIALWLKFFRAPVLQPRANDAERLLIEADPVAKPAPVKWRNILPHPQGWAFMCGKFLTDPVWWFYLFWSGAFLNDQFHVKLSGVALPLIYIYVLADVGSIAGGWLSSNLIHRGWTPNRARKTAMAVCAAFVLPVIFAPLVPSDMPGGLWIAATLIGCATAAHQGFSSNLFTTTSDMFPKRAVGSINCIGGLAGACGSILMQSVGGVTREITGNYFIPFFIAGCAYPVALLLIHLCAPRLQPVTDARLESTPMPRAITIFVFAVLGFVVAAPVSYLFQNRTDYRPYDRETLVTMTFTEMVTGMPNDLFKSAPQLANADKDLPTVTFVLNREPTPQEAQRLAELRSFPVNAYDKAKAHSPAGFTFVTYIAAVLPPGNIFRDKGGSDRSHLLPPLLWTPLGGIGIGALVGALLHGVLFRRKRRTAAP